MHTSSPNNPSTPDHDDISKRYTLWFQEIDVSAVPVVGGKGANLGEMVRAGMPVPPGFCVTAKAYYDYLHITGLDDAVRGVIGRGGQVQPDEIDPLAAEVRSLILEEEIPSSITEIIIQYYRDLCEILQLEGAADAPVAVRSSATAEDLPEASFAGQQDTYLNVRGERNVIQHVKACWASLWTARAMAYRQRQGYDHLMVRAAVVIQSMLEPETSGVLFTANPVSGSVEEVVLNASWGLGEAIVSGLVTPDTYVIRKDDFTILSQEKGTKEITILSDGEGGIKELSTHVSQRDIYALNDEQVIELTTLGTAIESHYGHPHDIEWAYEGDRCYVLQARPITTRVEDEDLGSEPEYNRSMFVELFPESLSPLFLSVMQHLIGEMLDFVLKLWGFRPPMDIEPVGVFYNQPYFNRSYIETALAPLPASVRERVLGQLMNPFGHQERSVEGGSSLAYYEMMVRMLRIMYRFPERLADIISEYQSEIAELQSLPIDSASDEELVARIREKVFGASSVLLGYDFLLIAITGLSYQVLGSFLERFAGEDTEMLRARLISGVDGNMTMETNLRLWDLAEAAKREPEVVQALKRGSTPSSATTFAELPDDSQFAVEFDKFLQTYGHREIRMDIMYPTWVEDPTPVLGFIRGYLETDSSQDPHLRQEELRRDRIEATKEVSEQLSQTWIGRWFIKPIFFWVLRYAQALTRERDTMHFELTRVFPLFRRYLHEIGRRWVDEGWIDQKEDVFFLTFDELEENAFEPSDRRKLVQTHKDEYEIAQSYPWPDAIIGEHEIFLREGPQSDGEEGELSGIASSPGLVSGVARLIRGPDDFNNLKDGDILVAPFTTPVWTPLFGIAGGVVTETGGILSHGAIVAREYGIPAVMSVANVMNLLEDGSQIVVDGDRGFVRVI